MGLFGIAKGAFKVLKGTLESDVEEIAKGGKNSKKCHRGRDF